MKRASLLVPVVVVLIVMAGVFAESLCVPASAPPAESIRGRSEADCLDPESPLIHAAQEVPPSREAVAMEPLRFSARPGSISGIVVNPMDDAIAGALCQVMKGVVPVGLGDRFFRGTRSHDVFASVRSDERGRFQIPVPEGFWALRVESEGMAPWEEGSLQPGDYRWIRLEPARDLTVYVRADSGESVSGAVVRLLKGEFSDPREALVAETTDRNGVAFMTSIPSGTWHVRASHEDYVSAVHKLPSDPYGPLSLEIRLQQGIRIVGRITLPGDQVPPLPGQILFDAIDGLVSSHAVESAYDGRYRSRVVFPGNTTLDISVLVPGFGESRKDVSLGEPPGEVTVDFLLETPDRSIVGRVLDPTGLPLAGVEVYVRPLLALPPETLVRIPSGLALLLNGLPDLDAYEPEHSVVARYRRASTTGEDGRFWIQGLKARGAYNVLLVSELYSNTSLWVEEGEPHSTTDLGTVQLKAGNRVWGYVRRPDGGPIEGAYVYSVTWIHRNLVPNTEFQTRRPDFLNGGLDSTTNSDGLFSIQPFPEGEFHLMCLGSMFGPYSAPLSGPIEIITEDVDRRDPSRRIPVALTILDETRAPVPKAYAQVRRARSKVAGSVAFDVNDWANWAWAVGDASGRVDLDAWDEGAHRIEIKDIYGQLTDASFVVELTKEGISREVVLLPTPDPSLPLAGVVRTAYGHPLADMKVALVPDTGDISCSCLNLEVRTDSSGSFTFGLFMKGNHRLVVTDPQEHFPASYYFPARPGDPIEITME